MARGAAQRVLRERVRTLALQPWHCRALRGARRWALITSTDSDGPR